MPVGAAYDYVLNNKGYMLQRAPGFKGRAWRRSGEVSVPGRATTQSEAGYDTLPDQVEFSEVWDDWSGGAFEAYRDPANPATYHWSRDCDTRFPRQLTHCLRLLPATTFTHGSETEALLDVPSPTAGDIGRVGAGAVLAIGRGYFKIYKPLNGEVVTETLEQGTPGANYGYRPATFGSYTYVPVLTNTHFQRRDWAGALVNTDAHGMKGHAFAVAGNRLWRAHGPTDDRSIYLQSVTSASPTGTANWSATLSIGDSASDIRDMIALNDQLYVGSAEGLFVGDQSGTFYNVMSDLSNQRHLDNCRDLSTFQGTVMAPHIAGLFQYYPSPTQAVLREVGPAAKRTNRGPVRGHVRCGKGLASWWYGGLWTGSQSWIVAGRPEESGWRWHTMQLLPYAAKVHRIHFDGITKTTDGTLPIPNRIWVATEATYAAGGAGTAPLLFHDIPLNYDNVLNMGYVVEFNGSFRIDMGSTDRGAPGIGKVYRKVEVWADGLASGAIYSDVYYTIDRGVRTLLGRAQQSPVSHLYFPSTAGSFTLGRSIEISLEGFTASVVATPVYRSVVLRGALLADSVDVITAQTRIADNIRDRRQAPMRAGAAMLAELEALASPSFGPVPLTDLAGRRHLVKVLPPVEESEVYQQGEDWPEVNATVRMAVMSFSAS